MEEWYRVLGVSPHASDEDLKRAYRDLVRVWHPDRFTGDSRLQSKAQETLKNINTAYDNVRAYRANPHPTPPPPQQQHEWPPTHAPPSTTSGQTTVTETCPECNTRMQPETHSWVYAVRTGIIVTAFLSLIGCLTAPVLPAMFFAIGWSWFGLKSKTCTACQHEYN